MTEHDHHDHEHAHGEHEHHHHEHEHEHEHEHHHDEVVVVGDIPVTVDGHVHEGASVGTLSFTLELPLEEAETTLRPLLGDITAWVEDQGGFVGHVKSSLVQNGPCKVISMTDAETADVRIAPAVIEVQLAAIVFGVELDELKAKMVEFATARL